MSVLPLPTPLHNMPLPDLESELLGLAGHIAAAECRFLQLLAEFDDRGGWSGDGIRSCAHWLSWRAGISLRTGIERLRVAHALQKLPRISEAFAAGKLSYSKIRALTRITGSDTATLARIAAEIAPELRHTTVADPETAAQILLNLALSGTASHVETIVTAVRHRHTPPDDHAVRRSLTWRWDDDGSLILRARLTPDQGATLIAAVEALVPPRTPTTHPVAPSPQDLSQRAVEQEPGPATDRVAARRTDALLTLVGDNTNKTGNPVQRGQAHVILHLDATTGTARLEGGPEIPGTTAARLACDARVQALLDDRTGNRMYLGRTRRLATPAQIAARTGGANASTPNPSSTRYCPAGSGRPPDHVPRNAPGDSETVSAAPATGLPRRRCRPGSC